MQTRKSFLRYGGFHIFKLAVGFVNTPKYLFSPDCPFKHIFFYKNGQVWDAVASDQTVDGQSVDVQSVDGRAVDGQSVVGQAVDVDGYWAGDDGRVDGVADDDHIVY